MALFITAHQMGTVLERASGIRLPDRVESTRMILQLRSAKNTTIKEDLTHVA
jgi:hypothetical protein